MIAQILFHILTSTTTPFITPDLYLTINGTSYGCHFTAHYTGTSCILKCQLPFTEKLSCTCGGYECNCQSETGGSFPVLLEKKVCG